MGEVTCTLRMLPGWVVDRMEAALVAEAPAKGGREGWLSRTPEELIADAERKLRCARVALEHGQHAQAINELEGAANYSVLAADRVSEL